MSRLPRLRRRHGKIEDYKALLQPLMDFFTDRGRLPDPDEAIRSFAARVPVHMLAELVAQGSTQAELLEGYPRLAAEMVRLAPVYAAAYPLRGRPRNQPWRDHKPVQRMRRRVDTIAMS